MLMTMLPLLIVMLAVAFFCRRYYLNKPGFFGLKFRAVFFGPIVSLWHGVLALIFLFITCNLFSHMSKDIFNANIKGGIFGALFVYALLYLPWCFAYYFIVEKLIYKQAVIGRR